MKSTAARKLKQVPMGYLVIGVDPHKKKHAAVTITQDFTTWAKFKFDNSREGFETMLQRSRVEMAKTGCQGNIKPDYLDAIQDFGMDTVLDETVDIHQSRCYLLSQMNALRNLVV